MNKAELIDRVALTMGGTHTAAADYVTHVLAAIEHGVMRDGDVAVVNFGKFERKSTKERVGRNPKTGAPLVIPAKHVVRFYPGKEFKDLVNGDLDGD